MQPVTLPLLLNRTLTVWRASTVPDGGGGQVTTWAEAGQVAARVSQPTGTEQVIAMAQESRHTHAVYLLPDEDVARGDELRGGGQTFEVIATYRPSVAVYLRADCELHEYEVTD